MKKENIKIKDAGSISSEDGLDYGMQQQESVPGPEEVDSIVQEDAANLKKSPSNNEGIKNAELTDFERLQKVNEANSLEILKDVPLKVIVELGRTTLKISEMIELGIGSIVELDKLYGDPVDIFVNNKLIGKGEVVVIDEDFAVRITEIVTKTQEGK
ncbi:MAG: flagellar motor switch protein FliN [Actinobacteria bacterium]|nr:flagellar motor switch protein FliN [Actinomycetota bacterium]